MNVYAPAFPALGCGPDGDFHFLVEAHQQSEQPVNGEVEKLAVHKRRDIRLLKPQNFRSFLLFQAAFFDKAINPMGEMRSVSISSAPLRPMSANTLPLPRVIFSFAIPLFPALIIFLRTFQPGMDQVNLLLRRFDATLRFLLERMQHINNTGEPKSLAVDYFQH